VTEKICPHNSTDRVVFSGTQVREMLRKGVIPPPEFTRPEVAKVLIEAYRDGGAGSPRAYGPQGPEAPRPGRGHLAPTDKD